MQDEKLTPARASSGAIWMAAVLLAGVLLMCVGYFQHQPMALYAGLLVTLAGVLNGVVRLVTRGKL